MTTYCIAQGGGGLQLVCRPYIKLTLKMHSIYIKCRQILFDSTYMRYLGFPGDLDGKESACNVGDPGLILGLEDPLVKGMATHSSILAWEIPWTEEGVWQATLHGVQRTEHNWVTDRHTYEMPKTVRCRVRKYIGRCQGSGAGGWGGKGSRCLTETEFQFRKVKNSGNGW